MYKSIYHFFNFSTKSMANFVDIPRSISSSLSLRISTEYKPQTHTDQPNVANCGAYGLK